MASIRFVFSMAAFTSVALGFACAQVKSAPAPEGAVKSEPRPKDAPRVEVVKETNEESNARDSGSTGEPDAATAVVADDDPMQLHRETRAELFALFWPPQVTSPRDAQRLPFLESRIGPDGQRFMNQGNKALARHTIGRATCLKGLEGITLQTPEQKAACGGRENMVPIYAGGDASRARACIDIFEFPNKPCELPMVWSAPAVAAFTCEAVGKRLCTQDEWNLSCRADPSGGPDSTYAYGNDLDLTVCNTQTPHLAKANATPRDPWVCNPVNGEATWKTCNTDTSPSGAYPKCRSRLGVFDLHGNVAEVMTRKNAEGEVVTQLKGSAFFYVDVAQKPGERSPNPLRETYPDHCNFDPRWHVEPLKTATHVNYHLGFRCCANTR